MPNDSCIHQNKSLASLNLTRRQNLPVNCCFNAGFIAVSGGLRESSPYCANILERIRNEMMFGEWSDGCRKVAFSFFFLPYFFLRSLNNFLWDVLRCHVNKSSDQNYGAIKMLMGLKTHQDR